MLEGQAMSGNGTSLDPNMLITDERSLFQNREFVRRLFKRADDSYKEPVEEAIVKFGGSVGEEDK
jgi:hypothetical protein